MKAHRWIFFLIQLIIAIALLKPDTDVTKDINGVVNRVLRGKTSNMWVFSALTLLMIGLLPVLRLNKNPDDDNEVKSDKPFFIALLNNVLALVISFIVAQKLLVMQPVCRKKGWFNTLGCSFPAFLIPLFYVTFVRSWNRTCSVLRKKNTNQ